MWPRPHKNSPVLGRGAKPAADRRVQERGALALAGLAAPAAGQSSSFVPYPPLRWVAEESFPNSSGGDDEGVDIAYWYDAVEDEHWIFVTGWVTEMNGSTPVGTRFATYKYDASFFVPPPDPPAPPTPAQEAYFPPLTTSLQSGDTYKAVKMTVDPSSGDVYITGEGPEEPGESDQDYVIVKYDKILDLKWSTTYDGPVGGDDIPADIAVDDGNQVVVVTGTSPGDGTGTDIATVGLRASSGFEQSDSWPDVGWATACAATITRSIGTTSPPRWPSRSSAMRRTRRSSPSSSRGLPR